MKNLQTFVIALPLLIVSSMASAVSVSGNIALTSDYIWRGMTQSAGGPAVAGGFDLSTDSGFYLGTWGSSVQFGDCLLYTSPSPRDRTRSRMPSSA